MTKEYVVSTISEDFIREQLEEMEYVISKENIKKFVEAYRNFQEDDDISAENYMEWFPEHLAQYDLQRENDPHE